MSKKTVKKRKLHKAKFFVQISEGESEGIIAGNFWKEHLWGDIRPAVLVAGREGIDFKILPLKDAMGKKKGRNRKAR